MSPRMSISAALQVLAERRTNEIVVTTMGGTREWSRISDSPYDFHYLPSAMGHAPMIGLGLALARPEREVVVLNGDGSMLMSLGCLVTIAASGACNLTVVVLENGVYEVTGGQQTPAALAGVDYATIARGAGFRNSAQYAELESWRRAATSLLSSQGPRFVSLVVEPVAEDVVPGLAQPFAQRLRDFQLAIGVDPEDLIAQESG